MHGRRLLPICKRSPLLPTLVSKLHLSNYRKSLGLALNSINFNDIPQQEEVFSFSRRGNVNEDLVARFLSMLRACHDPLDLQKGRQVHAQLVVNGVDHGDSLGTRLLGMYVLCRSFSDAKDVFFRLKKVSPLPWNWMIRGFTVAGWFNLALLFYFKMWFVGA